MAIRPLEASKLYKHTDPSIFKFETTAELQIGDGLVIGQPRAVAALRFGSSIQQAGYNIFAMGPTGMGKRSFILEHFRQRAESEPVPSDWVYVHNFEQPHRPTAIELPPGKGAQFQKDMQELVEEIRTSLVAAFESDEYRTRRQVIEQELNEYQEKALEEIQQQARENNFALIRTPGGLVFAPTRDGEVLSPEEVQNLSEEERKTLETTLQSLQQALQKVMQQMPRAQRQVRQRLKEFNREIINFAVGGIVDEMRSRYSEFPKVVSYLDAVREDVIENAFEFFLSDEESQDGGAGGLMAVLAARARGNQQSALERYKVNLLIDHRDSQGAPVIEEDNPTYQNLTGRVEHTAQMGALVTNFTLIKPGALHRANGGYLILDVRKVLSHPYAWEALKRSLQSSQIQVESIGQMLSLISTISLEPEPIPLKVKIALYGDRDIYYLLSALDPEFPELFKVQADFEEEMDRSEKNQEAYAHVIARIVRDNKLLPLHRDAVARVLEYSSRRVSDAEKLSTGIEEIADLLRESHFWAEEAGREVVTVQDVEKAINEKIFRADRLRERVFETILRGTFLIDTQGEKVGQVNGLSVIQLGGFAFARPSRITARVRLGKGEVINIEREVELSGPIHSKGVLILSGFLGARYARERPLTLSASLVFEQSYGGVDGDSASSAELYALLSAIAGVPIRQSLAVTGSINQHGEVQAIGGVNEKIEGFFDICRARGLTGDQGVLIPEANTKHLMLRQDVIDAAAAGRFHIYPVSHVDQGIELLTGIPAGEADAEGNYPPDTINGMVQRELMRLVEKQKEHSQQNGRETGQEESV
ncbi:MAG: AAA family ATPase [Chloroflexi bacterium]|nr:AAA family ATPase [Chloroflexota bacterium]